MRESSSSAGGQLEHPSEVNSSTITAFRFAAAIGLNAIATSTATTTKSKIPCSHERRFFIRILYGCREQTDVRFIRCSVCPSGYNDRILQLTAAITFAHQLNSLGEFGKSGWED